MFVIVVWIYLKSGQAKKTRLCCRLDREKEFSTKKKHRPKIAYELDILGMRFRTIKFVEVVFQFRLRCDHSMNTHRLIQKKAPDINFGTQSKCL